MPDGLRLEAENFTDLTSWRWVLKDASETLLATREVRLDRASEQFGAFTDLRAYISWHANGDDPRAEEARIIDGVGDWAATHIFGQAITSALARRRPATV
ncbi:MAG: hypothetical protein ACRDN0_02230, partial [Trebonia sp.]